jgi:hypothetical protein
MVPVANHASATDVRAGARQALEWRRRMFRLPERIERVPISAVVAVVPVRPMRGRMPTELELYDHERFPREKPMNRSRPDSAHFDDYVAELFWGNRSFAGAVVKRIVAITAAEFHVTTAELLAISDEGGSRRPGVVVPRQVAMYVARTVAHRTYPDIARRMGGRDHTTVLHAVRRTEQRLADGEAAIVRKVKAIREKVLAGVPGFNWTVLM